MQYQAVVIIEPRKVGYSQPGRYSGCHYPSGSQPFASGSGWDVQGQTPGPWWDVQQQAPYPEVYPAAQVPHQHGYQTEYRPLSQCYQASELHSASQRNSTRKKPRRRRRTHRARRARAQPPSMVSKRQPFGLSYTYTSSQPSESSPSRPHPSGSLSHASLARVFSQPPPQAFHLHRIQFFPSSSMAVEKADHKVRFQ